MSPSLDTLSTSRDFEPMRGSTGWIVTDGRRRSVAITEGVATALGLDTEHKHVAARTLWSTQPMWSLLYPQEALFADTRPPWPDIAIAAGHRTIPYLQALRRASEGATFTVYLHPPSTRLDIADLIWCPAHEHRRAPNIISTLTNPLGVRPHQISSLRNVPIPGVDALDGPVAALLAGPNRVFDAAALSRLAECLRNLSAAGVNILVAPCDRTRTRLVQTIAKSTRSAKRVVWAREAGSQWTFLAHADFIIVTADSVNRTSAACATGRPVYVFDPDTGSKKLRCFHETLRQYGATRPLTVNTRPTETWSYPPLDAAAKIASEILRRFNAARAPSTRRPVPESLARAGLC